MAKGNPLQEQLLKAGLVKKSKLAEVAREQHVARHAKAAAAPDDVRLAAERAREEKAERDRALAAEANAHARAADRRAQARQIVRDKRVASGGGTEYRFEADGVLRTMLVDDALRRQLASGALVIARLDDRFELLPRAAGDQVRARDPAMIVVDHGRSTDAAPPPSAEDDAYYAQFVVPDDLVW